MSIDLTNFELHQTLRCGRAMRDAARPAETVEDAAAAVVRYFREACVDPASGEATCLLARFYRTHAYGDLAPALRTFASRLAGGTPLESDTKCLVLLATAGQQADWNDRRLSHDHQAIPLPSQQFVEQAPMIAQLVRQTGLDIAAVARPSPELLRVAEGKTYQVFHVEHAPGSPYIAAQAEFVERYGVQSAVGFGGLHRDEFFAVILFASVPMPPASADRFRSVAVELRSALHMVPGERLFA